MSSVTSTVRVQRAVPRDLPRVSAVLSRAYLDDPVYAWCIPDPGRRRRVLPGMFALFAARLAAHDEIYVTGDGSGAALWAPPASAPVDAQEASEFGRRLAQLVGSDSRRVFTVLELLGRQHPSIPNYYYLQFVGVEPALRGRGICSGLIAPVLGHCDRTGIPAYVEATSPRGRALCERHGFETVAELEVPGGPTVWAMWRERERWS